MKNNYLNIGTSVIDISPPEGIELCGYASRTGGNTGIHDNLFAKAIVINDANKQIAIIACDLIGLDFETVSYVRNKIYEQAGFDPNSIMISCSHTHSGPATMHNNSIGTKDEKYINSLKDKLINLVIKAASTLTPAEAFYYTGECNIGINRRGEIQKGSIEPFPDPEGFVDKQVSVVAFYQVGNNKPDAILFNYGCHPTVSGYDNLLASADFPGPACRFIEKSLNYDVTTVFTNGGAGNINPIVRGSFNAVNLNGEKLGKSVIDCIRPDGKKLKPYVSFNTIETVLPFAEVPSSIEFEKMIIKYDSLLKESIKGSVEEKIYRANLAWAKKFLEETIDGKISDFLQVNLQALNIGEIYFIGIPGEAFAETSAWIKRQFLDEVIVFSYTNGSAGYLPTKSEIAKGGYEVLEAHKYYNKPGRFSAEAEENIKNAAIKLISSLKNSESLS